MGDEYNEGYRDGYRSGYKDGHLTGYRKGHKEGISNKPAPTLPDIEQWPPVKNEDARCFVCGIKLNEMNLYCCMNANCPSKVHYTC